MAVKGSEALKPKNHFMKKKAVYFAGFAVVVLLMFMAPHAMPRLGYEGHFWQYILIW